MIDILCISSLYAFHNLLDIQLIIYIFLCPNITYEINVVRDNFWFCHSEMTGLLTELKLIRMTIDLVSQCGFLT